MTDARKYIKSKFPGVRWREHPTRKHGLRPDRYFVIRFKLDGQDRQEALGWSSEGMTEAKAAARLAELKEAQRTGQGAVTLAEKRAQAKAQREAEQAEQERKARDALIFSDFFTLHYVPHASRDKKLLTHKRELGLYRRWISKAIGFRPLKQIGVVDLERLKQTMVKGGMKPRTIEYALAVVRQVFNHARRIGYFVGDSPTRLVKKPTLNNARLRYLEQHEAERLLKELETMPDDRDMALISLHCGLRFGEIASLTWGNVDLSKGLLTLLDTKHGDRQVPMTGQVKAMLESRQALGNHAGLIFPQQIRGGLRPDIGKPFRDAVGRAGLNEGVEDNRQKVVFHTLRHTFASWHVLAGTDLYTLGKLMGHKTPTMTARYGHLSPEGAARATRAFEAALETDAKPGKVVRIGEPHE